MLQITPGHLPRPTADAILISASLALSVAVSACGVDDVYWPTADQLSGTNLISSTFGPREQGRGDNPRYDFHRGLDIPAPFGSPARATMPGVVRIAGDHNDYGEDTVQLLHCLDAKQPPNLLINVDACDEVFYTNYSHLAAILVTTGQKVAKGEQIGVTGDGSSGLEHLHVEFRQGGPNKPNAIHPLLMLPHDNQGPPTFSIDELDASDPTAIEVEVTISATPMQTDVNRVEVELFALDTGAILSRQSYDFMEWNQNYSASDLDVPDFNGVLVEPEEFTRTSTEYVVHFRFLELTSELPGGQLEDQFGVVARAIDIHGETTQLTM